MKNNKKEEKRLIRFDWAIKNILRDKSNFEILEGFLSELLERDVKIVGLLESEGNKETKDSKFNRVDILVDTGKGEKIVIEVQFQRENDYLSRVLYGASKVITEYMQAGGKYMYVSKVISVNILYFQLGEGEDCIYKSQGTFVGSKIKDQLKLNTFEKACYGPGCELPEDVFPEYYMIRLDNFNDKIENKLDEWIYFLKTEKVREGFTAKGLKKASEKLDVLNLDPEERKKYLSHRENIWYENSMAATRHSLETSKEFREGVGYGMHEGVQKGINLGLKEGIEKGRAESRAESKAEGKIETQYLIAKNMKESKIANNEISRMTGLTIQEVEKL